MKHASQVEAANAKLRHFGHLTVCLLVCFYSILCTLVFGFRFSVFFVFVRFVSSCSVYWPVHGWSASIRSRTLEIRARIYSNTGHAYRA